MTDTIHHLIEQYGLIAVFVACVAEGETAAILAGFFAHQGVFVPWQAFVAVFLGAFGGDAAVLPVRPAFRRYGHSCSACALGRASTAPST